MPSDDEAVEETRQKLQAWMGVGGKKKNNNQKPSSILKQNPKYVPKKQLPEQQRQEVSPTGNTPSTARTSICKADIVERDPMVRPPRRKVKKRPLAQGKDATAISIEGFVPSSEGISAASHVESQPRAIAECSEDPLILDSVASLLEAAGQTMPATKMSPTDPDAQVVEADISFACMSQEDYQQYKKDASREEQTKRQEQYEIFQGASSPFEDESGRDDESGSDDDEDDDDLMDFLMEHGDPGGLSEEEEDMNNPLARPLEKPFLKIWNALSDWVTPQAVELLERWSSVSKEEGNASSTLTKEWVPQVDRSDVGASRCAGLMAMVKLHLPKCLEELVGPHYDGDLRLQSERRLADWLRALDYSQPMAKLSIQEWKAMTCILLDMVMVEFRRASSSQRLSSVPKSVAAVGITMDEYVYLTQNAILNMGRP